MEAAMFKWQLRLLEEEVWDGGAPEWGFFPTWKSEIPMNASQNITWSDNEEPLLPHQTIISKQMPLKYIKANANNSYNRGTIHPAFLQVKVLASTMQSTHTCIH